MSRRKKLPSIPTPAVIESLSPDGRGITHVDNRIVFIHGALSGEQVSFNYSRIRSKNAEGYVHEVIVPSPLRIDPKCPHYGQCGGCSLQHLSVPNQIRHKQQVLLQQLQHIGGVQPAIIMEPLTGPEWGYRRKARLGVKYVIKKERLLVGFREQRSNRIADLERCEVLHPDFGGRLPALSALFRSLSNYEQIPQIEIAVGENSAAMILRHLTDFTGKDRATLAGFQQETGIAVFLQSAGPASIVPLNETTVTDLFYRLPDRDIVIHFQPQDFTQVNFDINRILIARVLDLLDPKPGEEILELFCGIGNFSLPLAGSGAQVTGVEGTSDLVARARNNAALNNIDNVEFHALDLMQEDLSFPVFRKSYRKILLDPPRSGAREIIEHLDFKGVEKILYVSCNPATLARDAGILVRDKGFTMTHAGILDMFPHTAHVESIACFERK
jgi:23S rRNA (uracil1939-C5)-methyltransferase